MVTNYWIFNVKDDKNDRYHKKGIEIYRHRMKECFWGLRESTENGRIAANIGSLKRGDCVVFYLVGTEGHRFLGTCILDSGFEKLDQERSKIITHPEYLDWEQGVLLKDIDEWAKSLPIERLRGKVPFVPIEGNYGAYFQGSIKRIKHSGDYDTIIREHKLIL